MPTATHSGTPPPSAQILGEPVVTRPGVPVQPEGGRDPRHRTGADRHLAVRGRHRPRTAARSSARSAAPAPSSSGSSATDAGGGEATGSMVVVVDGMAPDAKIDGRTPNGIVVVGSDDLSGVESLTATVAGRLRDGQGRAARAEAAGDRYLGRGLARDRAGNVGQRRPAGRAPTGSADADRDRAGAVVRPPRGDQDQRAGRPPARRRQEGRRHGVQVAAGRRHVVESVDKAGNRSRVTILIPRDRPIARLKSPALDGPRSDELWPGKRDETGVRRYLLRAAEQRLVIAGALPAKFRLTTRFTAGRRRRRAQVPGRQRHRRQRQDRRAHEGGPRPRRHGTRLTWSGK